MGFYGNITNASRTTFTFDKIYSSRWAMDQAAKSDGIYAGRYVLVNYETSSSADSYTNTYYCYEQDGVPTMYGQLNACNDSIVSSGTTPSSTISSLPLSYATGANSTNNVTYTHFNYIGPDTNTKIDASKITDNTIIRINIGNHVSNQSSIDQYIRILNAETVNVEFDYNATEDDYKDYWVSQGEKLEEIGDHHAHIINSVLYVKSYEALKQGSNDKIKILKVPAGYEYTANESVELWVAKISDSNLTWTNLNTQESDFLQNFEYDKIVYGVSRGYDSTVWQKLYSSGTEKYVMIAELNTVVPTFAVSADAPTLAPIAPHFDTDSTNVYYKLHWQPSWGFRLKGANPSLTMPYITKSGQIDTSRKAVTRDTTDTVIYPSDFSTEWKNTFYNSNTDEVSTKYYNPNSCNWEESSSKNTQTPAAFYYNADGFNRDNIAYSDDLITEINEDLDIDKSYTNRYDKNIANSNWKNENQIALTPTGISGNLYNVHNNSADDSPKDDIQELSIMLPGIGDTVAHMWDLIYGGRSTDALIKENNTRNTDISWENGKTVANRKGLRLVTDENGVYYRPEKVETLAGCINTVHDILGMIIVPITADLNNEDDYNINKNGSITLKNNTVLEAYDDNKIYFDKTTKTYYRRHKTYNYTPITEYNYTAVDYDISKDTYVPDIYYILSNGEYIKATEYTENTQYYLRTLRQKDIFTPIEGGFTEYATQKYWYQDYSGNPVITDDNKLLLSDYIMYKEPLDDKKYYTITPSNKCELADGYKSGVYYQFIEGEYRLDYSDTPYTHPYENYQYYTIDEEEVKNISTLYGCYNIYVPNIYYYYQAPDGWDFNNPPDDAVYDAANNPIGGSYILDTNEYATANRLYYKLSPEKDSAEDKFYEKVHYDPVETPNENNFNLGFYYILEEGTTDSWKEAKENDSSIFNPNATYYIKTVVYQTVTEDKNLLYQLDLSPNSDLELGEELVNYIDNVFYIKHYDSTGKFLGYILQDKNSIVTNLYNYYNGKSKDKTLVEYYVFGRKEIPIPNSDNKYYNVLTYEDDKGNTKPYQQALKSQSTFYEPNKYHYLVTDTTSEYFNSYILDEGASISEERTYYLLESVTPIDNSIIFYQPYKYYVNIGEEQYRISSDQNQDPSLTYYEKNGIYVSNDISNVYATGSEWNVDATYVPSSLTLARRTETYNLVPLVGFARNLNTLHGMILKINSLLEGGDTLTRQSNNTQGVINQVNDIIARFGKLASDKLVIVDDYGRIRTTETSTQQTLESLGTKTALTSDAENYESAYRTGISKDVYPTVNAVNDMENQWVTINVSGHITDPMVTIHHNFQAVSDTTTTSNKNNVISRDNAQNTAESFDNNTTDDTLKLYTPIVDKMGHVVGKNTETVTLPYGFKTITATNTQDYENQWSQKDNNIASINESVENVIADNTQDILNINTGNKWIRLQTNSGTDTITLAHETHDFDTTSQYTNLNTDVTNNNTSETTNTNLSTETGDNITFQDLAFDIAGHMTQNRSHTYTLPYSFKILTTNGLNTNSTDLYTTVKAQEGITAASSSTTITDADKTTRAERTQDTLAIEPHNKWLQVQLKEINNVDTLTLAHEIHAVDEVALYTNLNTDITNNNTNETANTNLSTITGDNITFQDLDFDAAGHVIKNKQHTYTLPYSFKHYSTSATSATANADLYTTLQVGSTTEKPNDSKAITDGSTSLKADRTQDALIISPVNKWIQIKMDDTNDTISLAHEIHSIDTVNAANTDINAKVNDNIIDTITLQDMAFDAAGHLTENHAHVYTLPYGFKTITTNGLGTNINENSTTILTGTSTTAENTQDTLAINSGDKWIRIAATTTDNINAITISHDIHSVIPTTSTTTLSNETSENVTFDIPTYSFDAAGHYNGKDTKTLTMPFGYGNITGDNENEDSTKIISAASATFDTLSITGDTWITSTISKDSVALAHSAPHDDGTTLTTYTDNKVEPKFGDTFTIEDWAFDSKGHKKSSGAHTIMIPKGSYLNIPSNSAEIENDENVAPAIGVITSLDFIDTTNAITSTSDFLGNIGLGSYLKEETEDLLINDTMTLSSALKTIDSAVVELQKSITPSVETITESGVFLLRRTVDEDNKPTFDWVQMEEWKGGTY